MKHASTTALLNEAEYCRRQAEHFADKPEGPFLIGLAKTFDGLAASTRRTQTPQGDRA